MQLKNLLLGFALMSGSYLTTNGQTFTPPNMDFESGNTSGWTLYKGSVATGFIYSLTTTLPYTGKHTITTGTGTDYYGGFPEVGGGMYSLKLAHDTSSYNADAASYNVAVPATSTYSLIYQYAAVLEDPSHTPKHQPVFEVQAIDSATGTKFFDSVIYDPTPGFIHSTVAPNPWYKAWTNVSVDLSAYAGKTVTVKFIAAACSDGGHFGYAYIDVNGVFETSAMLPLHAPSVTLKAPTGYASYKWTDAATFAMSYGTTATVTLPAPTVKTKYALILTPAAGHGTVDTVYKTVDVTSTLGSGSLNMDKRFNIYPNPATGVINVQWTDQKTGTAVVSIADVTGRIVRKSVLNLNAKSGEQQIDLGNLKDGIYSVSIKSELINYTGEVTVQK